MMIESKSQLDLFGLIKQSVKLHEFDEEIIQDIYDFIVSRLEMYYQEQAIDKAVVRAVLAKKSASHIFRVNIFKYISNTLVSFNQTF
jgi:glycyl-tRNA synthetase beta chain